MKPIRVEITIDSDDDRVRTFTKEARLDMIVDNLEKNAHLWGFKVTHLKMENDNAEDS